MKMYLTVSKRASSHSWTGWTVTTYKWRPSKIGRRPPISNLFAWQQVLDPVLGTERDRERWNGAIWAAGFTLLCKILLCSHLQVPICFTMQWVERKRIARTCAVRDLWRAECGDYKQWLADLCDTQRPGGHLHIVLCPPSALSYVCQRCNRHSRTQHLLSNAGVPQVRLSDGVPSPRKTRNVR